MPNLFFTFLDHVPDLARAAADAKRGAATPQPAKKGRQVSKGTSCTPCAAMARVRDARARAGLEP